MESQPKLSIMRARISQVFHFEIANQQDNVIFLHDNTIVVHVRLFGIIISKFDKYAGDDFQSCFLTLDDGTGTISARIWNSENYSISGIITKLRNIQVGDICEISGRPRIYNDERYILLEDISVPKSINWEIKQRLLLLKSEREIKEIQEPSEQCMELLNYFETEITLNTVQLLKERSSLESDQIEQYLQELYDFGLIICPSEGYYKKVM